MLNKLKHSVFKAQDFYRPKLCFNTELKFILWMQITSVLRAKDLLFASKNKMAGRGR